MLTLLILSAAAVLLAASNTSPTSSWFGETVPNLTLVTNTLHWTWTNRIPVVWWIEKSTDGLTDWASTALYINGVETSAELNTGTGYYRIRAHVGGEGIPAGGYNSQPSNVIHYVAAP